MYLEALSQKAFMLYKFLSEMACQCNYIDLFWEAWHVESDMTEGLN